MSQTALEAVRIRNPVASGDDACFGTDPETSREFRKVIVKVDTDTECTVLLEYFTTKYITQFYTHLGRSKVLARILNTPKWHFITPYEYPRTTSRDHYGKNPTSRRSGPHADFYADKVLIGINRAILCRQGSCRNSDDSSRDELTFRGSYSDNAIPAICYEKQFEASPSTPVPRAIVEAVTRIS